MIRRFNRVKVATGFYKGYSGVVLRRRLIFWFAINVGGKDTFIGRWHLRLLGKKVPELMNRIRTKMIKRDKKVPPC